MDHNVRWPSQPVGPSSPVRIPAKPAPKADEGFARVWQETLQKQSEIKFSAHALQRLQTRRIELGEQDLSKISDAVSAAGSKGARSSLLLYKDLAMVASVNNRTIITAMSGEDLKEHIFTNIDSAVIIR